MLKLSAPFLAAVLAALCLLNYVNACAAENKPDRQVAITIDDLPSHGTLPPGLTRVDVAKSVELVVKDGRFQLWEGGTAVR